MTHNKKHILFLSGWFPSWVFPTNGDFIQRHAEAVSQLHRVSVLHLVTDSNLSKSIEYTHQNTNNVSINIAYIKPSRFALIKYIRFFKAFKKLLKHIGSFDVTHVNITFPIGLLALYLQYTKQKPYIITEHWTGYQNTKEYFSTVQLWLTKQITRRALAVCPVSNHLAMHMNSLGMNGHYHPVPNVVDTNTFKPDKKANTFTLVHISSLNDDTKNIRGILSTLEQLHKSGFQFSAQFIGGNNQLNQTYKHEFPNLNTHITYYEHLPHKQMIEHLQKAHAMVLFSHIENLPCVILEAFSCGVPVITTNVGGIAEYFPKDFGTLIQPKDNDALKNAIEQVAQRSHASPETMHAYAVNYFSQKAIAIEFNHLYFNKQ